MTPKEKAKQLIQIFRLFVGTSENEDGGTTNNYLVSKSVAKRSAILAVDEIMKEVLPVGARNGEERNKEIFWESVKQYIQSL